MKKNPLISVIVPVYNVEKYLPQCLQKNGGLSVTRNTGLAKATGEFVHFFDSDDHISVNFYEKMLTAAVGTGADMTVCNIDRAMFPGEERIQVEPNAVFVSLNEKFQRLHIWRCAWVWRYLFRRDFLKNQNSRDKEEKYEDRFGLFMGRRG